jgi:hypothetical protein
MSADVNALNSALQTGAKPEDLVSAPAFLFLEAPTAAGMENAQRVIAQHMASSPRSSAPAKPEPALRKPWWRFWG